MATVFEANSTFEKDEQVYACLYNTGPCEISNAVSIISNWWFTQMKKMRGCDGECGKCCRILDLDDDNYETWHDDNLYCCDCIRDVIKEELDTNTLDAICNS
jgi:hypothetical protein